MAYPLLGCGHGPCYDNSQDDRRRPNAVVISELRPETFRTAGLNTMSHPLRHKIDGFRTRVRRLVTVYAVSWTVAVALAAVIVLGLADYVFRFQDRGLRLICWFALLGAIGWSAYRFAFLTLTARISDVQLAARLQRRFPRLGDGLASAVEFLDQPEDDPTAGSVALRRAVITQTAAEVESLDFGAAIGRGPALRAAAVSLGVALAGAAMLVFAPVSSRIALARLVNPLGNVAWPQEYHLTPYRDVTKVARGQAFELEVVDRDGKRLPPGVKIHYRFENPDGSVTDETEWMRFVEPTVAARSANGAADPRRRAGVMTARRENVTRPFSYRVEGGDDRSMPWSFVDVVDPPAIESLSIALFPPEYTGWKAQPAREPIRVLEGTRVEIAGRSTKPLDAAYLCRDGGDEIAARLGGEAGRDFAVDSVVEQSGACWLELVDVEGLVSGPVERREIRAVADSPPSVTIAEPTANLFVTSRAEVPLRIAAKDDLAIRSIAFEFHRSDVAQEEPAAVSLYAGPERAESPSEGLAEPLESGDSLTVSHAWALADLELEPGAQITYQAVATDYRPHVGKSAPRRLTIITPEDLIERIAARQGAILAELAGILEMQQRSRGQLNELEIELDALGQLTRLEIDRLRGAELSQRQIARALASETEGLPAQIRGLLGDLRNNRVDSPDTRRQMEALLEAIGRIERRHLPVIERELTSAIKAAQANLEVAPPDESPKPEQPRPAPDPLVKGPLGAAGAQQQQVIESLNAMLDQLGRWNRYRQFHSDVSRLLQRQIELTDGTRELGRQTLTKALADLLPPQSAGLRVLGRRQLDLARELDEIQRGMEAATAQLSQSDPLFAATVSDALHRARELAISPAMRSAGGEIETNRIGQALERQRRIQDDLREVLDVLANRRESELTRLIEQLSDAQARLEQMAQREDALRSAIERAASEADDSQRRGELERLGDDQAALQAEAQRMARRLERLMAESAGQATAHAAGRMDEAARSAREDEARQASKQAAEAKQSLDEAARRAAERQREAELELARQQMQQLEEVLAQMRQAQQKVFDQTRKIDELVRSQGRLTRSQAADLNDLAALQRSLEDDVGLLIDKLVGADVFHLALGDAGTEMGRAASLLERRETGDPTQQAERAAIERLGLLLEALEPEEPDETAEPSGQGQSGQGGQSGDEAAAVQTLAQLKLLRLLQRDVNLQTRALEQTFAPSQTATDEARREYDALSRRQGRLADLLLNLAPPPDDAPEPALDGVPASEGNPRRPSDPETLR